MGHPGQWLDHFVNAVGHFMQCMGESRPIQCHAFHNDAEDGEWEITVFGEPQRFGGRLAALDIETAYTIDVLGIAMLFDEIESCRWQTSQVDVWDELGPHAAFLGTLGDRKIWLRVCSRAPKRLQSLGTSGDIEVDESPSS